MNDKNSDFPVDIDTIASNAGDEPIWSLRRGHAWSEARDELLAVQRDAALLATVLTVMAEEPTCDHASRTIARATLDKLRSARLRAFLDGVEEKRDAFDNALDLSTAAAAARTARVAFDFSTANQADGAAERRRVNRMYERAGKVVCLHRWEKPTQPNMYERAGKVVCLHRWETFCSICGAVQP